MACAKHFAVHSGPEWNRHTFNVENLPERDLWETYLPAFKSLVQEGKVYNGAVDVKTYEKSATGFSCIIYNMDYSDVPPEYFADWAEGLEEARNVINSMINSVYDTYYGKITYVIITRYWEKFSKWTAAKSMHHTQLGGLLTHTADVISIADKLANYFNELYGDAFINRALLLCSAALHDVGKIFELDVDINSGKTEYTRHAVLSTHIMDVLSLVDNIASELGYGQKELYDEDDNVVGEKTQDDIDDEVEAVQLLKHCLAAHHGKLEYGSPITPSIPEATLLNIADNVSAEMFRYNKVL